MDKDNSRRSRESYLHHFSEGRWVITKLIGIDAAGLAVGYANATRAQRQEIAEAHEYYVKGLMWFWRNDSAVPAALRAQHAALGLCKDEW